MTLKATIRNAPDYPAVGEIAVYDVANGETPKFKMANGAGGFEVLNVKEDSKGAQFNGQPYLWFELKFPGNLSGWVRDEYVVLEGDGKKFGMGNLTVPTGAFTLIHGSGSVPTDTNPPTEEPADETPPVANNSGMDRVVRVALDMTATFEGGYSTYQNYDDGIISYGRFQFTLAGGALFKVVNEYVSNSTSETAQALKATYLSRIGQKDEGLREDAKLKELLRTAAREEAMQNAQNHVAKIKYWDLVMKLSAEPRGVQTPLGRAIMMDMAINHGPYHDYFTESEKAIGVAERSKMPGNGGTEAAFFKAATDLRKERMYRLADKHGWGGLKVRADFWVDMVARGDWNLEGDADGKIYPKPGREVNAR